MKFVLIVFAVWMALAVIVVFVFALLKELQTNRRYRYEQPYGIRRNPPGPHGSIAGDETPTGQEADGQGHKGEPV